MPYQILPNIIFLLAVLGLLMMILRRLPEAAEQEQAQKEQPVELRLLDRGLPAVAISGLRAWLKAATKKLWNFALEAKDLKPSAMASYRIKKMFGSRFMPSKPQISAPASLEETKTEDYYLGIIKRDPKNLANYDALGRYYLEHSNGADARDIYDYLTKHDSANADYHARLAYCYYQLKDFQKTAEHYRKSLALDSSQPNRYYNLGLVLEALGQDQEAIDSISRAIALEPKNARYYISYSNACLKLGRHDQALNALQKAHEFDPNNETIRDRLEKLKVA